MRRLGRLLLNVVIVALLVGLGSNNGQECAGLFGPIVVGFAFCVLGDLLDVLMLSSFTNGLRRLLWWCCAIFAMFCALAASYQDLFPQPQDIHSIQDLLIGGGDYYSFNIVERMIVCGSMPGTVAAIWLASVVDYYYEPRAFVPLVTVGGALIGGAIGFVIQLLSMLGHFVLFGAMVVVTVLGVILLLKYYKKHGWIFAHTGDALGSSDADYDTDYGSSGSSGRSSGRSYSSGSSTSYGTSSYSGGTSEAEYEGNHQLDYYMDDIASDNSRSRNLPYGCSIRSDVSFSHYGDDAYFTVDFTLDTSCCSAETQHEYDMMISDAQSFQREVMNDLFREGKNLIGRLKQKYKGWPGVNFEVKLGDISEY